MKQRLWATISPNDLTTRSTENWEQTWLNKKTFICAPRIVANERFSVSVCLFPKMWINFVWQLRRFYNLCINIFISKYPYLTNLINVYAHISRLKRLFKSSVLTHFHLKLRILFRNDSYVLSLFTISRSLLWELSLHLSFVRGVITCRSRLKVI